MRRCVALALFCVLAACSRSNSDFTDAQQERLLETCLRTAPKPASCASFTDELVTISKKHDCSYADAARALGVLLNGGTNVPACFRN